MRVSSGELDAVEAIATALSAWASPRSDPTARPVDDRPDQRLDQPAARQW